MDSRLGVALASVVFGFSVQVSAQQTAPRCPPNGTCPLPTLLDTVDRIAAGTAPTFGALKNRLEPNTMAPLREMSRAQRGTLSDQLQEILGDPNVTLTNRCRERQVRANAGWMLYELADTALGNRELTGPQLVKTLLDFADAETDERLRRQAAINLLRLRRARRLGRIGAPDRARIDALIEEILPSRPDYQQMFGAGGDRKKINVVVHGDKESFTHSDFHTAFTDMGGRVSRNPREPRNTHWTITYPVKPAFSTPGGGWEYPYGEIEFTIELYDRGSFDDLDLFRHMGDNDPQVEVYGGHSNYGDGLRPSWEEATPNKRQRKEFLIGSCKSDIFGTELFPKYPNTRFIFTVKDEFASDTPQALARMLESYAYRETYAEIRENLKLSGAEQTANYIFPDDERILMARDSDGDGILDLDDRTSDCGLRRATDIKTLETRRPPANWQRLTGRKIAFAAKEASNITDYAAYTRGYHGKLHPDGYSPPDMSGPFATFTTDRIGGEDVVKVRVNSAYSHRSAQEMAIMMTHEFAAWLGDEDHVPMRTLTDKQKDIVAYGLGLELLSVWDRQELYDAYQTTYSLGSPLSWDDAIKRLDKEEIVTERTIRYIESKLR